MKHLNRIIAIVVVAFLACGSAFAMNEAEKTASKALSEYLKSKGFDPQFSQKDNSVNFFYKKVLFWVTFDGNGTSMLFTLHRMPKKMISDEDSPEKNARRVEIAKLASNYMNVNNTFKTFVADNKVKFEFPVYAASASDYNKTFDRIFKTFADVDASYNECHKKAKLEVDSIHKFWMENDSAYIVVSQPKLKEFKSNQNLNITTVDFRNVDANGNQITGYDDNIRKSEVKFIQPRISVSASKKGTYKIGVKIINPKGKILVPTREYKVTTLTPVDVNKTPSLVELDVFGINDGSIWEAGEYQVVFLEDNHEIRKASFNVL